MRISDWSSDVCSSDLQRPQDPAQEQQAQPGGQAREHQRHGVGDRAPAIQRVRGAQGGIVRDGGHQLPALRDRWPNISRESASTMQVTMYRTKQSTGSAERHDHGASPKSSALTADGVGAVSRYEAGKAGGGPKNK